MRHFSAFLDESVTVCDMVEAKEVASQLLAYSQIFGNMEEGKDLSEISPFLINKAIASKGGPVVCIRKLQNGTLLVEKSGQK